MTALSTRSPSWRKTMSISIPATRTTRSNSTSSKAAKSLYEELGVAPGNMTLIEGDGGHAFVTTHGGVACEVAGAPYRGELRLRPGQGHPAWIYGPLAEESAAPSGKFILFDQGDFSEPGDGLADEGVVYVPEACADAARLPGAYRAAWL